MARYFRRKKLSKKGIIALVVAAIIIVGAIVGIAFAINNANAERKTLSLNYAVGGLSETGAYKASETSIYTKSAFACEGLEIDINDNSDVKFEVYYYGKTGAFISSTGMMSKDYAPELKNGEKTARIVVTPVFSQPIDEDDVVGYAKQLKVSVYTKQGIDNAVEEAGEGYFNPVMQKLDFNKTYRMTFVVDMSSSLHDEFDSVTNPDTKIFDIVFISNDGFTTTSVVNNEFVCESDDEAHKSTFTCEFSVAEIYDNNNYTFSFVECWSLMGDYVLTFFGTGVCEFTFEVVV